MQYRRPPSLRTAAYQDRLWPMSRPHAVFERRFDGLAARQLVAGPVRHALEGALARGVGSAALRGGPARADRGRGRAHQRPDARHRPAPFRLPSAGIHTPRARQCPLARLPPRAAGPNPTGARGLLELATADVRAGRPARPGELPGAGDRCLRGDDARGRHRGRRIPLHPPRPGGPALRRPERDGPRPGGRGFEGGHPSHLERHLLPPGRPQGSPARRPAAALRRRRRLHLGRAGREAPGWPDPADRRRHPQRAGAAPGRHAAGRVLGGGAVRAPPRSTPPASATTTSAASAPPARPSACARPPSATWPTASAPPRRWPPPAARCASAATATPSSTCSRSPAPWSWTSAWPRAAAATTARPRCSPPPRLAAWRRSAGATPAASRPAPWPTSPPSTWARRGWRAPAPKTSSTTWCSPPPPPTSPTS